MKTISRSIIYKGLYKDLEARFGHDEAHRIWALAERVNSHLYEKYSADDKYGNADMLFPAATVYLALRKRQPGFPAMDMLRAYGTRTGERMRKLIHAVTMLPGASYMIWKNIGSISDYMSSEKLGYTRQGLAVTKNTSQVDVLSCPIHDLAKKIGMPEVCQTICAMDKVYMTGFRHIQYRRTKSVAEGDECCDYRLWWDREKK